MRKLRGYENEDENIFDQYKPANLVARSTEGRNNERDKEDFHIDLF
jgi:hypothetical protein